MIKRKFGMRYLNISQGRFNSFSHKNLNAYDLCGEDSGIDRFITFNDLEVIGKLEFKSTGFANTVLFYDIENDITLAMTHCNNIAFLQVGQIMHCGDYIYYEGTTGKATGNHIHLEIGKGRQSRKVKINASEWGLKDWINIEDYFYVDDEYTTIINSPYEFKKGSDNMGKFIDGYQELSWLGESVKVYQMKSGQSIGLMSAMQNGKENWQARETIDKIDNEQVHYAKMNCNFFDMGNGQHYGVEQGFENDFAPKQDGWYCLYITKENEPKYVLSSDYWLSKNDVRLAFSPCAILRHDSQDLELRSTSANQSLATKTNNSMLLYMGNGVYAFMVTGNNLTSLQCRDFAKAYGAVGIYECDGGGSSQLIVNGVKKQYTGRAIANVLTFYKTVEEIPTKPDFEGLYNDLKAKYDSLLDENENTLKTLEKANNKLEEIKKIVG